MAKTPSQDFLRTDNRLITLLFCDLRGFTAISQKSEPEEVQGMVNTFLGNMVSCIDALEGTVDKFIGDAVMALFGAPMPSDDHALRALLCAVKMRDVHNAWQKQRADLGLPTLPMGIGLATGTAVVGNIGTKTRVGYSALGETVYVAGKLCDEAKAGEILTTVNTHRAAHAVAKQYPRRFALPRFQFNKTGILEGETLSAPVGIVSVTTA